MKNKIRFIIPRLLALTAIIGVASFVLAALFKILFLGVVILALGLLFAKICCSWTRKANIDTPAHEMSFSEQPLQSIGRTGIVPMSGTTTKVEARIIPIY